MKVYFPLLIALVGLTLTILVCLESAWADDPEQAFIEKASIGGQFEISSSRLALQNSQNPDVKNFAQEMLDDHTQIASQLKSAIAFSHPDEKRPSSSLDSQHRILLEQLRNAKGANFDKLYIDDQVKAHNEAVNLFSNYSESGTDDTLKTFAARILPTLEEHQSHALELKDSM